MKRCILILFLLTLSLAASAQYVHRRGGHMTRDKEKIALEEQQLILSDINGIDYNGVWKDYNGWRKTGLGLTIGGSVVAGGGAISAQTATGERRVTLAGAEAGFPLERTKPEYYLGDQIEPPENVDWNATYERFLADQPEGILFDPVDNRVFTTAGGTLAFTWILSGGSEARMTYVASATCSGRPRKH